MVKSKKTILGAILCFAMVLCLSVGVMFAMPTKAFANEEGFGIILGNETTIKGEKNEEQIEFKEYIIEADLTAGDTFQLYDLGNEAAWTEANIDEASTSNLIINEDDVYEVTADGKYTIYLKMIGFGNNQVYVAYEGTPATVVEYSEKYYDSTLDWQVIMKDAAGNGYSFDILAPAEGFENGKTYTSDNGDFDLDYTFAQINGVSDAAVKATCTKTETEDTLTVTAEMTTAGNKVYQLIYVLDKTVEIVDAHGIIIQPAKGETKEYNRLATNTCFYYDSSIKLKYQSGTVTMVECADGTVYWKDPISAYTSGAWIKGKKEGSTITFATKQPIFYKTTYKVSISVRWGYFNDGHFSADDNYADSFIFDIDGDSLIMRGTQATTGSTSTHFLGIFWDDDDSFYGDGDCGVTLTAAVPTEEGFGIILGNETTIKGEKNEEQIEFKEYIIEADLTAGDTFQLYDLGNEAAWTEANIDEASTSNLIINEDDVYEVTADGKYTIYLKMISFGNNQVYVAYEGTPAPTPEYTTYENWQIKYGNVWAWSDNMEKVEDGLFKIEILWEGTGINVKSDENPIKKDWYALEELTIGEEVIAPVTVDVYLKIIDDETLMIGIGVIPTVPAPVLTVTVADILPDDFPTSDDGDAPLDAWVNSNNEKMFSCEGDCYIGGESDGDFFLPANTKLTKDGNNYKCTKDGATVTFVMSDNALISIIIEGLVDFDKLNGTYKALVVNVAQIDCPTCGGDGLAQCSECYGMGCDSCGRMGNVPCTDCDQTGKTLFTTLKDAISEVKYYGKITLLKDNSEEIEISKEAVFVIDKATFTFDKSKITAGTGYEISTSENGTETTFIVTTQKTIADILATLEGNFPTTEEDAWVNEYLLKAYLDNTTLYIGSVNLAVNTSLTKSETNYVYSCFMYDVKFVMTQGKLTSIEVSRVLSETANGIFKAVIGIKKPVADETNFVYNGEEQTYTIEASDFYTINNNVQTNAGNYTVTVSLKDKVNYKWKDGDSEDLTFSFVINKITVNKPNKDTTNFVYNGEAQTYTVEASDYYTVNNNVQTSAGNYTVTVSLNDKDNYVWADGTADDLTFEFVINKKAEDVQIKDENEQVIENSPVSIIDAENGIAPDAILVVKVVNAKDTEETDSVEKALIDSQKIAENEKIYAVYDVKLLINDIEGQPDGKLTVKMLIPQELRGKEFRLYHIHASSEIYEIYEYSVIDAEGYVTFEIDKLSEFAFVADKNVNSLSAGAIVGIVLGSVVFVVLVVYVLGYFFLYRKGKLDDKKIKVIYKFLPKAK